ncbi:type II toxin-antitoxin system RelE/ParE family toxin [uncultured Caulobacter sp.]|uniref:type II toxin-antitoxin system RelE/ParE family toxin n=1 Tax=uncultured Caulobacter sp. TaxID=158749 RepID=UPI0026297CF7|nr:type II toxin-antitoxin system RelE/ParE family toxin [uncultured Caulobacter sp.]
MSAYRLKPRAKRDLDEIWIYSKAKWGPRRALAYLRDIEATIMMIARNPDLGPINDALPDGYRQRSAGSHLVFYRRRDGFIEVVRILHRNVDFDSHLP